jgi:ribosomal protein S8
MALHPATIIKNIIKRKMTKGRRSPASMKAHAPVVNCGPLSRSEVGLIVNFMGCLSEAHHAKRRFVCVPRSKEVLEILKVLLKHCRIRDFEEKDTCIAVRLQNSTDYKVSFFYKDNTERWPALFIVTTLKGIMSWGDATKAGLDYEVLMKVDKGCLLP